MRSWPKLYSAFNKYLAVDHTELLVVNNTVPVAPVRLPVKHLSKAETLGRLTRDPIEG